MIYKGLRAVKQQYNYKQTHRKDPALSIYGPKAWTDSKLLLNVTYNLILAFTKSLVYA